MAESVEKYVIEPAATDRQTILGIVKVHRQELNEGFLSSLGETALSIMFEFAAASPCAILLTARERATGKVVGFLLGTPSTGAFYKDFLKRKSLKAAFLLAPKLISFKRIFKILETLFYPAKKAVQDLPSAELLDVAVLKECQGSGLGKRLFEELCRVLKQRGIQSFRIPTSGTLHQAHQFYERLGARKVAEVEVHKDQKTLIYVYQIP